MMKQDEMTQQELIACALQDHIEELNELQRLLQAELQKPAEEQDTETIREITQAICELTGEEASIGAYKAECVAEVNAMHRRRQIQVRKSLRRWLASACACAVVIIAASVWSAGASDRNILSAAVKYFKGSVELQMSEPDEIVVPTIDEDPYGIVAKCEEYGFTPLTPTYLPEGFELDDISTSVGNNSSTVVFYYKKDNILKDDALLNFQFWHFNTEDDVYPIGFPTDTYELKEEVINGITMVTLKEDDQFKATFQYENTFYLISGHDLDYDECYKVAASFAALKE